MPRVPTVEEIKPADDGSGFAPIPDDEGMAYSHPTMSDIPCATLMLGDTEFVSQSDGRVLIIGESFNCIDEHQAMQLFVWLSNHLRVKL